MAFRDVQDSVRRFAQAHGLTRPPSHRTLDLVSEVGELAKEILKGSDYGRQPLQLPPSWSEELGDVCFSLICLANETGVDLDSALNGVLQKYEQRLAAKGDAGSGR